MCEGGWCVCILITHHHRLYTITRVYTQKHNQTRMQVYVPMYVCTQRYKHIYKHTLKQTCMIDTGPSWMYSRADFLFPDILGLSAISILFMGTQLIELYNNTNHYHYITESYTHSHTCVYTCMRMCTHTHTHTHNTIYIYIYILAHYLCQ